MRYTIHARAVRLPKLIGADRTTSATLDLPDDATIVGVETGGGDGWVLVFFAVPVVDHADA